MGFSRVYLINKPPTIPLKESKQSTRSKCPASTIPPDRPQSKLFPKRAEGSSSQGAGRWMNDLRRWNVKNFLGLILAVSPPLFNAKPLISFSRPHGIIPRHKMKLLPLFSAPSSAWSDWSEWRGKGNGNLITNPLVPKMACLQAQYHSDSQGSHWPIPGIAVSEDRATHLGKLEATILSQCLDVTTAN